MNGYAAKADANQPQIVKALRQVGAVVLHLHTVGRGCPDLAVSYRGQVTMLEIKAPGGKLTPQEAEFIATWGAPVHVVYSPAEALEAIGASEYKTGG